MTRFGIRQNEQWTRRRTVERVDEGLEGGWVIVGYDCDQYEVGKYFKGLETVSPLNSFLTALSALTIGWFPPEQVR